MLPDPILEFFVTFVKIIMCSVIIAYAGKLIRYITEYTI